VYVRAYDYIPRVGKSFTVQAENYIMGVQIISAVYLICAANLTSITLILQMT